MLTDTEDGEFVFDDDVSLLFRPFPLAERIFDGSKFCALPFSLWKFSESITNVLLSYFNFICSDAKLDDLFLKNSLSVSTEYSKKANNVKTKIYLDTECLIFSVAIFVYYQSYLPLLILNLIFWPNTLKYNVSCFFVS